MATLAVFNQKGGAGRTTTALNLLAAVARHGRRPLGIDLDPQAQLSQFFGVQSKRVDDSICSFFTAGRLIDDVAQITKSGVALCPAHRDLARIGAQVGRSFDSIARLGRALKHAEAPTGPVVIDCDRLLSALTLNALVAADLVVVPVPCDFLALQSALAVGRALDALEPVLKRRPCRRYLLTRFNAGAAMAEAVATRLADAVRIDEVCATRIRECADVAESPTLQLDIFRHAPASDGAVDYEAFCAELGSGGFLQ
jgi:chromosome partitioning protein